MILTCPECQTNFQVSDFKLFTICPGCGGRVARDTDEIADTANPSPNDDESSKIPASVVSTESEPHSQPTALKPDSRISRYRIVRHIGGGGFGEVYLAHDDLMDRPLAIKVAKHSVALDQCDEFLNEARNLAKFHYEGIVAVFDCGIHESRPYIVSEFVEGSTLREAMKRRAFSFEEIAKIIAQVARSLHIAHRKRLIHRDVKPANILLRISGDAVLADFGLVLNEANFGEGPAFAGSYFYMSPEQASMKSQFVDGRGDIFSLGVVFFELLTGQSPYRSTQLADLRLEIQNIDARPPRLVRNEVPMELDRICVKAMSRLPAGRYSTAGDFADDLEEWLRRSNQQLVSDSVPRVITHGLRSFDQNDRKFFVELLPGNRDTDGFPEPIRFWKQRIDSKDNSFSVGLILGTSGAGKSSLVKAGVIPSLSSDVIVCQIECSSTDTEGRLLSAIKRSLHDVPTETDLVELIAAIRAGEYLSNNAKLLIVLDQFEQWLQLSMINRESPLVTCMRYCEGSKLQSLLVVREDFGIAAVRFMEIVESPIMQGHNFAVVDHFDASHARKVLELYGRSLGKLPHDEAVTESQSSFLEAAVRSMVAQGYVIPLRIAVFSQTMRNVDWEKTSVVELSGESVGVRFLESSLGSGSPHPIIRASGDSARRILEALLPGPGSHLRSVKRSRDELFERAKSRQSVSEFNRLVDLLDQDLRLITPVETVDYSTTDGENTPPVKYQLTHDFLVPAIRDWVRARSATTARGRARLAMADRFAFWNAKRDSRQLPSIVEFFRFLLLVPRIDQPLDWRRMMRRAGERHARNLVLGLSLAIAAVWITVRFRDEAFARATAQGVVDAELSALPSLIENVSKDRGRIEPLLVSMEQGGLEPREQRNVDLALLPNAKESRRLRLLDGLLTSPAEEIHSVSPIIEPYLSDQVENKSMAEWIREQIKNNESPPRVLRALALLGKKIGKVEESIVNLTSLTRQLVREAETEPVGWIHALRPIKSFFITHLMERLHRGTDIEAGNGSVIAAQFLADWLADEPDRLVEASLGAPPSAIVRLVGAIASKESESAKHLEAACALDSAVLFEQGRPAAKASLNVTEKMRAFDGQATGSSAWALDVPNAEIMDVMLWMKAEGYRPTQIRPHADKQTLTTTVIWTRNDVDWRWCWEKSEKHLREWDTSLQDQGFTPIEIVGRASPGKTEDLFSAIWIKPKNPPQFKSQLIFPIKNVDFGRKVFLQLSPDNYRDEIGVADTMGSTGVFQAQSFVDHRGDVRHCVILAPFPEDGERPVFQVGFNLDLSYRSVESIVNSKLLVRNLSAHINPETNYWEQLLATSQKLLADQNSSLDVVREAKRDLSRSFYELGKDAELKKHADSILEKNKNSKIGLRYKALASTRLRDPNASKFADEYCNVAGPEFYAETWFISRMAPILLEGKPPTEDANPTELVRTCDLQLILAGARLQALAASKAAGELRSKYLANARELLKNADEQLGADFVELERDRDLGSLVREWFPLSIKRDQNRFAACWHSANDRTDKLLGPLEAVTHREQSAKLMGEGFSPTSISVLPAEKGRERLIYSTWSKPEPTELMRDAWAKRKANAAVLLERLGNRKPLETFLAATSDEGLRVRTFILNLYHQLGGSAATLTALLENDNPIIAYGSLMALIDFEPTEFDRAQYQELVARTKTLRAKTNHGGVHSAADLLLRKWNEKLDPIPITKANALPADAKWWVDEKHTTFLAFRNVDTMTLGNAGNDDLAPAPFNSIVHSRKVDRNFAIAATKVTIEEFKEAFPEHFYNRRHASDPTCPVINLNWIDAARYCNWRSQQAGLPKEEWCYPEEVKDDVVSTLPTNWLKRKGYRLPTEAEWEYVARCGRDHIRHFGYAPEFIDIYDSISSQRQQGTSPIAQKKPSDWGFFDMLGNALDWTNDLGIQYPAIRPGRIISDDFYLDSLQQRTIDVSVPRTARGASWEAGAAFARSAQRWPIPPNNSESSVQGFRLARTIP